jgi:hypothetical protein
VCELLITEERREENPQLESKHMELIMGGGKKTHKQSAADDVLIKVKK